MAKNTEGRNYTVQDLLSGSKRNKCFHSSYINLVDIKRRLSIYSHTMWVKNTNSYE